MVQLFGNPKGIPVVVLHGGPGAHCTKELSVFFNLSKHHVVMFDQRGAGKSKPADDMYDNTPQTSVKDIELLREHFNIDKWIVFGGSYGSLLALLYGQTHPERVLGFVLRGIFLGRSQSYMHLITNMAAFFPVEWQALVDLIPEEEQNDLLTAFDNYLTNPEPAIHQPVAQAFMYYDFLCAQIAADPDIIKPEDIDPRLARGISRAFIHYAIHDFYLEDNYILNNMHHITHLPAIIVHGRHDLICLPRSAYALHKEWQKSADLWFIPGTGHLAHEPAIARALKVAMEKIVERM